MQESVKQCAREFSRSNSLRSAEISLKVDLYALCQWVEEVQHMNHVQHTVLHMLALRFLLVPLAPFFLRATPPVQSDGFRQLLQMTFASGPNAISSHFA